MKIDWINRLAKWRSVFAGWQLGTRPDHDPECQAIRDHREATLILRAEVSALVQLLITKGVFTTAEFKEQIQAECQYLCKVYEERFPGFQATDVGMSIDPGKAVKTTRGWKP